jgi:Ran-binding protein 3
MHDGPNGADNAAASEQSASGSESGRGRLRRKRSREDFEEDEKDKPIGKRERHVRKKSRDVTSPKPVDADVAVQPLKSPVSRIDEHDGDARMAENEKPSNPQHSVSNGGATPPALTSDREESTTSPKNKRTREQASSGDAAGLDEKVIDSKESQTDDKSHDEPKSKRPREKDDLPSSADTKVSKFGSLRWGY